MIERDLKEIQGKITNLEERRDEIMAKINDDDHMQSKDLSEVFGHIDEQNRVTEILQQMQQNIQKLLQNKLLTFQDVLQRLN